MIESQGYNRPSSNPNILWGLDEIAAYLRLRLGTTRGLVQAGQVPAALLKIGRKKVFISHKTLINLTMRGSHKAVQMAFSYHPLMDQERLDLLLPDTEVFRKDWK